MYHRQWCAHFNFQPWDIIQSLASFRKESLDANGEKLLLLKADTNLHQWTWGASMSFLQMLSDYAGTWADLFTIAYLQPSFVTYLQEARVLSNILQISYRKQ